MLVKVSIPTEYAVDPCVILIVNAVDSDGGLITVNPVTASSIFKLNDCPFDKSTFTLPDDISSSSTFSCKDLTLNLPSISTFDLGDAVPNPMRDPDVTCIAVPLAPTIRVEVVTIPALMIPADPFNL